jgi:hypothetical protein
MLAEQEKNILAAVAIDFLDGGAKQREVYLYPEDVVADSIKPLKYDRVIRVTFDYLTRAWLEENYGCKNCK